MKGTGYDNIIAIDDDPLCNMISKIIWQTIQPAAEQHFFADPVEGLNYLQSLQHNHKNRSIVLLDLNMPVLSGWDILEKLQLIKDELMDKCTVFILSSSVDTCDVERSASFDLVKGYLHKPLTHHKLAELLATYSQG